MKKPAFAGFLLAHLQCAFVRFANANGALATTGKGAIPALPELAQIHALLREPGSYDE